jgi:hypothetical protein
MWAHRVAAYTALAGGVSCAVTALGWARSRALLALILLALASLPLALFTLAPASSVHARSR